MATFKVQFRRGTTAEHTTFTGAQGEITYDTETNQLVLHDGVTPGGHRIPLITDVPTDLSQLTDENEALPVQLVSFDYDAFLWTSSSSTNAYPYGESFASVGTDSNGNIYAVGNWNNTNGGLSVKLQPDGTQVYYNKWGALYEHITVHSVAVAPNGNHVITGAARKYGGGNSVQYSYTAFLNSYGVKQWDYWWGNATGRMISSTIDSSGTPITLSRHESGGTDFSTNGPYPSIVKWQSNGNGQDWTYAVYGNRVQLYGVGCDPNDTDNNIYAVGNTTFIDGITNPSYPLLIKLNSSGSIIWQKRISGSNWNFDNLSFDNEGNIITVGKEYINGSLRARVAKWDTSGTLLWQGYYTNGDNKWPDDVHVDTLSNGDVVIYYARRYSYDAGDVNGGQISVWMAVLSGTDGSLIYDRKISHVSNVKGTEVGYVDYVGNAVAVDSNDNIIIVGRYHSPIYNPSDPNEGEVNQPFLFKLPGNDVDGALNTTYGDFIIENAAGEFTATSYSVSNDSTSTSNNFNYYPVQSGSDNYPSGYSFGGASGVTSSKVIINDPSA